MTLLVLKVLQLLSGAVFCEIRDSEKVTPVDPSCSHNLVGEDGCSIVKECSEEDDGSDDDYASIQRPAFMVDGEPNFDSGPIFIILLLKSFKFSFVLKFFINKKPLGFFI